MTTTLTPPAPAEATKPRLRRIDHFDGPDLRSTPAAHAPAKTSSRTMPQPDGRRRSAQRAGQGFV